MPLMILIKETNEYRFYGSLQNALLNDFPELKADTVNHYLTRLKKPYNDSKYTIFKGDLIKSTVKKDKIEAKAAKVAKKAKKVLKIA